MKVKPDRISCFKELPPNKKLYFASDFHLGAPNEKESLEREWKIIRWMDSISKDAAAIFLVGDIFDFWFEYKFTIPKGFIRFQGKLTSLIDQGIPIIFFTGNHDKWMFDYFPKILNIPVYHKPIALEVNNSKLYVGHGDGLGSGEYCYKFLQKIFENKIFQWLFQRIHPNTGMTIAKYWSKNSRIINDKRENPFRDEEEGLFQYSKEVEAYEHHDYYIFGHRHLPIELAVSENATYLNLGEWMHGCTYLEFDGQSATLKTFVY